MPESREKLFTFLESLMPLTEEEKSSIAELALFRNYPKGAVLFKEGDVTRESYLVITGCVRSYMILDGNEITTGFYTELDSFAPPGTVNQQPSSSYAACLEESLLIVSTPELEEEAFAKFPKFETLCRLSSEKLMAKSQLSFEQFRTLTPEQRYLHLMETRPNLIQRVPQYHLATYLGIRPESLSRIRKRLAGL